jgi:hypothetical protein
MYTATEWDSVEDKEKFAKHFKRFVQSDFKRGLFYRWFYNRLHMTFGFIAHYNLDGFYTTYFEDAEGKNEFLRLCRAHPCYGDPAFTYSDVERDLQNWLEEEING